MPNEPTQPEQSQQQPQQFPMTNFGVLPDKSGGIVTIHFTPLLFLTQIVPPNVMDDTMAQWSEAKKQKAQELQLFQDIKNSRGRENLQLLKSKGLN